MHRKTVLIIILIAIGAGFRLLPHAPNFAPVGAIALYAGALLPGRWSFAVPVAALFASDLIIGFYEPGVVASVYGSFLLTILIGRRVGSRLNLARILAGSLSASILFFLVTNAAVWMFGHGYVRSGVGLLEAYAQALPFFRNTLLSDFFYSGVFFGVTAFASAWAARRQATSSHSFHG